MKKTEIFFPFEPVPKGRPRFTRTGHSYTPQKTRDYEQQIAEYYKSQTDDFYDGAIKIKLIFHMPIPKSFTKKQREFIAVGSLKCIKRVGDIDNLSKAILDSLNEIAFQDDCLITKLYTEKCYATSAVGTEMIISEDVE